MKYKKKKFGLPLPPEKWYRKALALHGIRELPITGSIAFRAVSLPDIHNDPCDRFIIAAAIEHGCPVVTGDAVFKEYPGLTVV